MRLLDRLEEAVGKIDSTILRIIEPLSYEIELLTGYNNYVQSRICYGAGAAAETIFAIWCRVHGKPLLLLGSQLFVIAVWLGRAWFPTSFEQLRRPGMANPERYLIMSRLARLISIWVFATNICLLLLDDFKRFEDCMNSIFWGAATLGVYFSAVNPLPPEMREARRVRILQPQPTNN